MLGKFHNSEIISLRIQINSFFENHIQTQLFPVGGIFFNKENIQAEII